MGVARRHERHATARRGEESWTPRHAHGRKILWPLGAELYRRRHTGWRTKIRVQARSESRCASAVSVMVVGHILARAEPGARSEAPPGYTHLRDAADVVGQRLYGASWGSFAK